MSALAEYYADILPDLKAFTAVQQQPLPTVLWTNTLKTTPEFLQAEMRELGFELKPLVWDPTAFSCDSQQSLGKCWPYYSGLFQIQEAVSQLPRLLLQAQPGEKILDLCAAPGNKTAQLSVAMKNQGTIIANDRNYSRMRAMGHIIKRLGLINISTTIYDGTKFPDTRNYFDKVLVDVPCSCEGTGRKGSDKVFVPNRSRSMAMSVVQLELVKKALDVCRVGGKILYSTCTFAPEENERVISQLLKLAKGRMRVVPVIIPGFHFSPGVTQWQGENFHPEVIHAMRVWPHLNNTGGFFLAMLEKTADLDNSTVGVKKLFSDEALLQPFQRTLEERFGVTQHDWNQYRWLTGSKRGLYLTNSDHAPPKGLHLDATGMFALKTKIQFPKLTTAAAMLIAPMVQKSQIALTADQLQGYYSQQEIILSLDQVPAMLTTGYVLLSYRDTPIGMGLFLSAQNEKPNRVRSLFPRYLV